MTAASSAGRLRRPVAAGGGLDRLYAADVWQAGELGVPAARGRSSVNFSHIDPPWLRDAVKCWCRRRLASGGAFSSVAAAALALSRFSAFLSDCQLTGLAPAQLDRALLERYLAWLTQRSLADATKSMSRVFLRAFLDDNRRHRWAAAIPAEARLYHDEVGTRSMPLPRFIDEYVMSQLETQANLARLRVPYRHLVVLITETGLRAGDACVLPFDPLVTDSAGWPCLRFYSHKVRSEHLLPLSARALETIQAQQHAVTERCPDGSPWLFPARSDPNLPVSYGGLQSAFARWQRRIGLHDKNNQPFHVHLHALRHTLGTRLINSGVPQHVVQRLLTHVSPIMTGIYAHLHDSTIRTEFERYCQTRVDVQGRLLGFDPEAATADAEWVKHRLSRAAETLPNGYCGRPPQQDCPHPNACLTCPDFQTTVEFLPVHREQAQLTRELLNAAETAGRERLAANHRKVLINLDKIVSSLEKLRRNPPEHADG